MWKHVTLAQQKTDSARIGSLKHNWTRGDSLSNEEEFKKSESGRNPIWGGEYTLRRVKAGQQKEGKD